MAVTDYGITYTDVLAKLNFDSRSIPATGGALSIADLNTYIEQASALVTGWVEHAGRDAASLGDDAKTALAIAIESHAAMQALLKLGHGEQGSRYQAFKRRFESEQERWTRSPQVVAGAAITADSNVAADATPSDYSRSRFMGW